MMRIGTKTEGPVKCQLAWAPNVAVGAHGFKSGVRFDPRFGPDGSEGYPMGSETERMERLDAAGHRAWFAGRACERHMIGLRSWARKASSSVPSAMAAVWAGAGNARPECVGCWSACSRQ